MFNKPVSEEVNLDCSVSYRSKKVYRIDHSVFDIENGNVFFGRADGKKCKNVFFVRIFVTKNVKL
jgi:hypothetical protein